MAPTSELDAVQVYGAHGLRIFALIDRCRMLTPQELGELQLALEADFLARTDTARAAALGAARSAGRWRAWTTALRAVGDAVEGAIPANMTADLSGAVSAVPAWVALALIVGDLLTPEQHHALVKGWLDAGLRLP